jgi:hypothetical protein
LYLCLESIRDVSLSGQFKIGTDMLGYKNELVLYADRIDDDDLSFHKWFTKRHEKNVKKKLFQIMLVVELIQFFLFLAHMHVLLCWFIFHGKNNLY